ncbi:MAG TPA: hypothetical protein PK082_06895, partial [Phycisphaerae bacterium]|nr:hypothetical protein [Phycisphaerae bacterium]
GPGVVAGRGYLRLDLAMVNGSKTDIDISQVVVSGRVGTGAPAPPVYPVAESPSDFSGVLAPGKEARAVYVVAISPKPGEAVTITVDFDGAHTSAVFTGPPA